MLLFFHLNVKAACLFFLHFSKQLISFHYLLISIQTWKQTCFYQTKWYKNIKITNALPHNFNKNMTWLPVFVQILLGFEKITNTLKSNKYIICVYKIINISNWPIYGFTVLGMTSSVDSWGVPDPRFHCVYNIYTCTYMYYKQYIYIW